MFTEKLVIRSQTGLSLHERFTALRGIKPVPASGPPPPEPLAPPQTSRQIEYYVPPSSSGSRSRPEYHGLFEAGSSGSQQNTAFSRTRASRRSTTLAFQAALKLKKKSIKQRLGPFKRHPTYFQNYPRYYQRRGYQRGRAMRGGRGANQRGLQRWTSTHSLASDGMGRRRGSWRGRGVGQRGGRGFRGGGRRGRGYARQPKMTKEELDAQLDSYMSKTKTVLDRDLDAYMSQGANTTAS